MLHTSRKVTREDSKIHNSNLVLRTIYTQGEISRAGIARQTRLTAATVSTIVADLIERGLVEESGPVSSARGKPPTLVHVATDAFHLIGLDLARSEFQGAVTDLRGKILHQASAPIDGQIGEAALALVYQLIDRLLACAERPILGIGIGSSGIIDARRGLVLQAVNFGWYDLPLQKLLAERYGLPVHIANDNDMAALAEYSYGRYKNSSELVTVNVGYGIGAGLIINHQIYHGHGFGAGEIGHVTVVEDGEQCRCGNRGCLETVASSRAITQRARLIAESGKGSLPGILAPSLDEINIQHVVQAYLAGDQTLQPLVDEAGRYLGIALANLVGVLSIEHILLSGSVAGFGPPLFKSIQQEIERRSLARSVSKTRVEPATFEKDAVLLGTVALLLSEELGVA